MEMALLLVLPRPLAVSFLRGRARGSVKRGHLAVFLSVTFQESVVVFLLRGPCLLSNLLHLPDAFTTADPS